MIIERKYVTLKKLYMTDPLSKEVIDKVFKAPAGHEEELQDLFRRNSWTRLFNATMGCCIPNFGFLWDSFEELDKTNPYDNGKTIKDVDHAEVLGWKQNGSIVLMLCDAKGNAITLSVAKPEESSKINLRSGKIELNWKMFPD